MRKNKMKEKENERYLIDFCWHKTSAQSLSNATVAAFNNNKNNINNN